MQQQIIPAILLDDKKVVVRYIISLILY